MFSIRYKEKNFIVLNRADLTNHPSVSVNFKLKGQQQESLSNLS